MRRSFRRRRKTDEAGIYRDGDYYHGGSDGILRERHGRSAHVVSPRNRERAAALHEKYPQVVSVAADNQEVIDRSDWVFVALLHETAEQILEPLVFPQEKKFINLVATLSLRRIAR